MKSKKNKRRDRSQDHNIYLKDIEAIEYKELCKEIEKQEKELLETIKRNKELRSKQ